jgi:hypothetical protein
VGCDDIAKRSFLTTFKKISTDDLVGFDQRDTLSEVQKNVLFLLLSEDTNEKRHFLGGNLLACIFDRL